MILVPIIKLDISCNTMKLLLDLSSHNNNENHKSKTVKRGRDKLIKILNYVKKKKKGIAFLTKQFHKHHDLRA